MSQKKVETAVRYLVDYGQDRKRLLRSQVVLCNRQSAANGIAVVEEYVDSYLDEHRPKLTEAVEYCVKYGIDYLLIPSENCIGGSDVHFDCKYQKIIDEGVSPIILADNLELSLPTNEYATT